MSETRIALTATEIKALREAYAHPRGLLFVEVSTGRGPEGGTISTGKRNRNTAQALTEKGLFRKDHSTDSYLGRGGYGVKTRVTVYELTAAGREVLAVLDAEGA